MSTINMLVTGSAGIFWRTKFICSLGPSEKGVQILKKSCSIFCVPTFDFQCFSCYCCSYCLQGLSENVHKKLRFHPMILIVDGK